MRQVRQVRQVRGVRCSARVHRCDAQVHGCDAQVRRYTAALCLAAVTLAGVAAAQTPTQNVEVDPVACWWRTSVITVRVGQTFPIVLTCSVLETDAVRAVVDRSRLASAAVQFPPYEVVGGNQHPDHVTAGRRFIQYEYLLRLISEDSFGLDVPVAGLEITYRIESRVEQDASLQGREQSYELPALIIRVASLVPESARGIREPAVPTFAAIGARGFRARMFRTIAMILFGIAALTLVIAIARWFREGRTETDRASRPLLANRTILAAVRRELAEVERDTRGGGWTPEAVGRALAASRVVASYVAGRAVVQRLAQGEAAPGELVITSGFPLRRRVAVSGSTTTAAEIDEAMNSLTAARYGRKVSLDASELDDALKAITQVGDRVSSKHSWLAETLASLRETSRGWRPKAWAR